MTVASGSSRARWFPRRRSLRRPVLGRRRWLLGVLGPVVVAGVALAIGSGLGHSAPQTPAQRAGSLDAQIRCPSCTDVSVADSSAPQAVAVAREVLHETRAGWSDQRIEDALVARYGPSILLRPPARGLTILVWIVPAVVATVGFGAVGLVFWRRGRAFHAFGTRPLQ